MRNFLLCVAVGALLGAALVFASDREAELPEGASVREARLATKALLENNKD